MAFYHPLKGFILSNDNGNGKKDLKVVPWSVDHVEFDGTKWISVSSPLSSSVRPFCRTEYIPIPCGQCIGCKLSKAREWAFRCMMESQYYSENYFVTLTYDDKSVPVSFYGNHDTGEVEESLTLRKRDFQLFIKRLRESQQRIYGNQIRYFGCGEYGGRFHRPHGHFIFFGLHLEDLKPSFRSKTGHQLYSSEYLSKIWDSGIVTIGDLTFEDAGYVSRYTTKKLTGKMSDFYEIFNIEPEFILMSRKPGIGGHFYDDYKDSVYEHDSVVLRTALGGKTSKPPKYFDRRYDIDNPAHMAYTKSQRKQICDYLDSLKDTDLSEQEYREAQEYAKLKQSKLLRRSLHESA